jgi:hypothetical protein
MDETLRKLDAKVTAGSSKAICVDALVRYAYLICVSDGPAREDNE